MFSSEIIQEKFENKAHDYQESNTIRHTHGARDNFDYNWITSRNIIRCWRGISDLFLVILCLLKIRRCRLCQCIKSRVSLVYRFCCNNSTRTLILECWATCIIMVVDIIAIDIGNRSAADNVIHGVYVYLLNKNHAIYKVVSSPYVPI